MSRRKLARRASGYRNRKKAAARRSTHRSVRGLLAFASDGIWPVPAPRLWLTHEDSPALSALQGYVNDCLEQFQAARQGGLHADVREVPASASYLAKSEAEPPDVFLTVARISAICHQLIGHLQENERWRNVYRCATCRRWFLARSDRPNADRAFCGRKCWPSKQPIRSEAPTRRIVRRTASSRQRN
jgi:hypothetical protein